jgi:hypothetical protein
VSRLPYEMEQEIIARLKAIDAAREADDRHRRDQENRHVPEAYRSPRLLPRPKRTTF